MTIPFHGTLDTDGIIFWISQTGPDGGSGGVAILGESHGVSRDGSPGVGVQGTDE